MGARLRNTSHLYVPSVRYCEFRIVYRQGTNEMPNRKGKRRSFLAQVAVVAVHLLLVVQVLVAKVVVKNIYEDKYEN